MQDIDWERRQASHYDEIAVDYEAHYSDQWSRRYRRTFIYDRLTEGIDLSGLTVLDAMCGSGQLVAYLASKAALVTGLDNSERVIELLKAKLPDAGAVARSIFDSGFADGQFDAVMVVGGLHHVQPEVDRAIDEIHRILKPGGYFAFAEPHVGSVPDLARRIWYRFDSLFEANELGIDVPSLEQKNSGRFEFLWARYTGGPAYLLTYNSMVFRAPRWAKRLYSPLLLRLERPIERLQGRRTSCMVLCQWRKKQVGGGPGGAPPSR